MKKIGKKLTAMTLLALFASMQMGYAALDTGLGKGLGGAEINNATGGYTGTDLGENSATLNFKGDSHVNWNTLNLNKGETLNFNATNGATGLTILNTVNRGMSKLYGNINANNGIGHLIISNPNGVLFDGAHFSTAGDTTITTQPMVGRYVNGALEVSADPTALSAVTIKNSDFSVGGEMNFVGDTIDVVNAVIRTKDGAGNVRFTTTNGQDYIVTQSDCCSDKTDPKTAVRLEALYVDGNVYVTSDKGVVKTVNGGSITGNMNVKSNSEIAVGLNVVNDGKVLSVGKDLNVEGKGQMMYLRNANVNGNLDMKNSGGFVEVYDVNVGGNAKLTTTGFEDPHSNKYDHFVHVVGNTVVGGNLDIESSQNIHIGGYVIDDVDNLKGHLVKGGSLIVGGDLNAHTTGGHITTTMDTRANNINYHAQAHSENGRMYGGSILSDGKAVLTANTYKFKADGYIGGIKDTTDVDGNVITKDNKIISIMEDYTYLPVDLRESSDYLKIAGGEIKNITAPEKAKVNIASLNDVKLTGANAGDINLTAYDNHKITITGPDVHAKNINIGPETGYLKLDFEGRDFTTNYTNIKDEKVVTIRPDEVITYELADGNYNQPTLKPGEKTTYLIGPEKDPGPTPPGPTPPGPTPPGPEPNPDPVNPDPNDSSKLLHNNWAPDDIMQAPVDTPVAFAADLDDDEEAAAVRKNVDGSVTVVRAFPMMGS